jgi:16S rRNA (uracil1498-N3)-methyltransferase
VGDRICLLNGRDGEWQALICLITKSTVTVRLETCLRGQPAATRRIGLAFAPLKKDPMAFLIQKSVELGVDDLLPILTHRTITRSINRERISAQIIEAAEQCGRLTVPDIHPVQKMDQFLTHALRDAVLLWACERPDVDKKPLAHVLSSLDSSQDVIFLIGPEGGFDPEESATIHKYLSVPPVDLGTTILRAETAALMCLSAMKLCDMTK